VRPARPATQGEYKPQYRVAPEWEHIHELASNASDYARLARGTTVHELGASKGLPGPAHYVGAMRFRRGAAGGGLAGRCPVVEALRRGRAGGHVQG
jgi:hypothetical protein